jgi:IclR family acetate operon transcriptional repressor
MNYLDEHSLTKRTSRTIVSREILLLDLRRIRQRGYAIADGEHDTSLRAISAPLFDDVGNVRAARSLNGTPALAIWRDLRGLVAYLTTAARDISGRDVSLPAARISPSSSRSGPDTPRDR